MVPSSVAVMDEVRDEAARLDRMVQLQRQLAAIEAELASEIHGFVQAYRGRRLEAEFATDEVAAALRWGRGRVVGRVHDVAALRRELPVTWAAWRSGEIDGYLAGKILEARNRIIDATLIADFDAEAASVATEKTSRQLQSWLAKRVVKAEPEQFEARYRRAFADRRVETSQDLDGMGSLWATTSAFDLTRIDYRLTRLAQDCGAEDPRTLEQRRADIFVDLILGQSTGRGAWMSASAAVAVTVPVQSLVGADDTPGEICCGGSVPASVVREIATRPGTLFYRLLTDEQGTLLDVAQLGRFPTPLLGFAVDLRDQTCRFPGCIRPAAGCDCDHTIHHPDGATTYVNLGDLCRRHHRCKQTSGYAVEQVRAGVFEWTMPSGRCYTVRPEPLPVARWPAEPGGLDPPEKSDGVDPPDARTG